MTVMYTANYASVKKLPKDLRPISISIGVPKWWTGESDKRLAPSWKMLKSSREIYDRDFLKQLKKLDARAIYEQLGDNAVLLCYETHNDWCHRRLVAEWFESELGIEVPEYGFDREDTFPYKECNEANKGKLYRNHKKSANDLIRELTGEPQNDPEPKKPVAVQQRLNNERQMTFFDLL